MTSNAYSATYVGPSRRATRRRGQCVPALRCGDVVLVVEERASSVIAVGGPLYDATFGFRYVILRSQLVR
jgi:hypothetical protein